MLRLGSDQSRVVGALLVSILLHLAGTALIEGYSSAFSMRAMLVLASLLAIASIGQTLVIITGATPVASDQRSASSASAVRPSTARSATVKLDASARPV